RARPARSDARGAARGQGQGGGLRAARARAARPRARRGHVRRGGRAHRGRPGRGRRARAAAAARHPVRARGGAGARVRRAGRRGAARPRLLELRHVRGLRGARRALRGARARGGGRGGRRRLMARLDLAPAGPMTLPDPGIGRGWEGALLLTATLLLVSFGLVTLYSASAVLAQRQGLPDWHYAIRQAGGALAGLALLGACARTPYRFWRWAAWPLLTAVA